MAFAAGWLVLFATEPYGLGIGPDSVSYLAAARSMLAGEGVLSYTGRPMVLWPPFYSVMIAATSAVTGFDVMPAARVLAFLAFAATAAVSCRLFFQYVPRSPLLIYGGCVLAIVSGPMFGNAVWAFSETLFTLLVLMMIRLLTVEIRATSKGPFLAACLCAGLASLTRYLGVAAIGTGALAVLFLRPGRFRKRLGTAMVFGAAASLPLTIWFVRNRLVAGCIAGQRGGAQYALSESMSCAFDTLLTWFLPSRIVESRPLLLLLGLAVGTLVGYRLREVRPLKILLKQRIWIVAIYVVAFMALLVLGNMSVATDSINNRLSAPVYLPLILVVLALVSALTTGRLTLWRKVLRASAQFVVLFLLSRPVAELPSKVTWQRDEGVGGYGSRRWRQSKTIKAAGAIELRDAEVYSNRPDALYILADIEARMSLGRWQVDAVVESDGDTRNSNSRTNSTQSRLLVWFDDHARRMLASPAELEAVIELKQVARFNDGTVYRMTPLSAAAEVLLENR